MSEAEVEVRVRGRDDLADLHPYRAPQEEVAIRLNANESPYSPPPEFAARLAERIAAAELNRYPPRDFPELREALAEYVGTITERVWAANGSNEVLLQLLLAFGGSERKAMTFEPTYAMHSHIARISATRLLRGRRNPDFTLQLDATIDAVRSQAPEIVFLCSPNNPTGNSNSEEEVEAICNTAPGLVVLDEAYAEFAGRGLLRLVEDFERLVVVRSFSKTWRLAGARLGYLIAQPWVIEEVGKVRLPYHLSTLAQLSAVTALEFREEMMSTVETVRHERDRLWGELSTLKGVAAFPSEGNFILFRCEERPAGEVWQALYEEGILIRDFSDLPGCEDCLRVSVGTPEENERFLETLNETVRAG